MLRARHHMSLTEIKAQERTAAFARRKRARGEADPAPAIEALVRYVLDKPDMMRVSGYAAIRTELDPLPALKRLHKAGRSVCLPVVLATARPLVFRPWTPGQELIPGAFGAPIPADGPDVEPDLLVVPLLAFDRRGFRLGYGGGFYDRTLARLRAARPTLAVGLAFSAQEIDQVPAEDTDLPLDAVATEHGLQEFVR